MTSANTTSAITLNFRGLDYSAEKEWYKPVEIQLENKNELWKIAYITDFSFQGSLFPELVKEIFISFIS